MTNIGVHVAHCCVLHGCKYGDRDCPVVSWEVVQEHPCEGCAPDDGDLLEVRVEVRSNLTDKWYAWNGDRVFDNVVDAMTQWHGLTDAQEGERPLDLSRVRLAARVVTPWVPYSPPEDYSALGG